MKSLLLLMGILFATSGLAAEKIAVCTDPVINLRSCSSNQDCPPGDQCLDGECKVAGSCFYDFECGVGRRCVGGRCY